MTDLFSGIYKNKRVLVTGHTGFKGSWLCYWLDKMGANVMGYALKPSSLPNHYEILNSNIVSVIGDIGDREKLKATFEQYKPEIVFHLAAQPLVRYSYEEPVETFETNVMGTINIFEACRKTDSVRAIVNITSDKAYENREWVWGYREKDPMGGYDPYSASKGCAELVTSSYRDSFFNLNEYGESHNILLASCRAGNVIGGGDWAEDRIMTDVMMSIKEGKAVKVRNPSAIRPWQHVLEPLSAYLLLGKKLLEGDKNFAEAWNIGPGAEHSTTVEELLEKVAQHWDKLECELDQSSKLSHEAHLLKLDCSKATEILHWKSVWNINETVEKTVSWYKAYYENKKVLTEENLNQYISDAKRKGLGWAN